jgi:hypothetical protein
MSIKINRPNLPGKNQNHCDIKPSFKSQEAFRNFRKAIVNRVRLIGFHEEQKEQRDISNN